MIQKNECFGSTTVGEKGQVVIPAEARRALAITKGDKLLVFGKKERGMLLMIEVGKVSNWLGETLGELAELSSMLGIDGKKDS